MFVSGCVVLFFVKCFAIISLIESFNFGVVLPLVYVCPFACSSVSSSW